MFLVAIMANTYGDLNSIHNLMTQIIARDIASGVELARSLGHRMPTSFDIGVKFISKRDFTRQGEWITLRLRLDDATYDVRVEFPYMNGLTPMPVVERMLKAMWQRIHSDCLTLAQVWLDKHPDTKMTGADATKALAILDAINADPALYAKWMKSCRESAKRLKYETKR